MRDLELSGQPLATPKSITGNVRDAGVPGPPWSAWMADGRTMIRGCHIGNQGSTPLQLLGRWEPIPAGQSSIALPSEVDGFRSYNLVSRSQDYPDGPPTMTHRASGVT